MAFQIIPFDLTTKLTINTSLTITPDDDQHFYYDSVCNIYDLKTDEQTIFIHRINNTFSNGENIYVFGTTIIDDNYNIENDPSDTDPDITLKIPFTIIDRNIPIPPTIYGYVAKKRARIKKTDTPSATTDIYVLGDLTSLNGKSIYLYDSVSSVYIQCSVTDASPVSESNYIMKWMNEELYGMDNHTHITMVHTIKGEPGGGNFFGSTGTNKNSMLPKADGVASFALLSTPIFPCTTPFKSHMDGRVRTVVAAFHPPETAMVENFTVIFNAFVLARSLFPDDAIVWRSIIRMSTIRRMAIAFTTALIRKNWADLYDEVRFFKKKMLKEGLSKLKLIANPTEFNTYFSSRLTFNDSTEVLRCFVSLEGSHAFDMDTTSLHPRFAIEDINHPQHNDPDAPCDPSETYYGSATDPDHDYYGGYHKDDIELCKSRLDMLMLDPSTITNSNTEEEKKFATGLILWTPMHHYWNGMGGHCKSVPKNLMTLGTMPDQRRYMNRHVGTTMMVQFGNEMEKVYLTDRGLQYDKNTHLTELGRRMIKHALINGLIIDIKHSHPKARNQILKMAENGHDFPPEYNIYGNPKVISESLGTHPDTYFEELVPCSGSVQESNLSDLSAFNKNYYQIAVTHAALSYVDDNATCADYASHNSTNTTYLQNFTITKFLSIEKYLIKSLSEKSNFRKLKRIVPGDILNDVIGLINNDPFDDDDFEILGSISTNISVLKNAIIEYVEKFYITHIIRLCYQNNSINIGNNEIARVIILGGVIGVTSEDRVIRSNENMFTSKYFKCKKQFFNINLWPIYGVDVVVNDYLCGRYYSRGSYSDFTGSDARIELENEIAFGENGVFNEIQCALESLYEESLFKYSTDELYIWTLDLNKKIINDDKKPLDKENVIIRTIAGIEGLYRSIDQIARVAREKVYSVNNTDPNLSKYALNVSDNLNDDDPTPGDIGIKTKLKKYYENITISSDFDGLDDPLDLFASPRMYPIMALYIANRLKWDLYRRYCAKPSLTSPGNREFIEGNNTIGPERGQTLNVDEGAYLYLNYFRDLPSDGLQVNDDLNDIVKDIMKQILDTNFINMVANARGWS